MGRGGGWIRTTLSFVCIYYGNAFGKDLGNMGHTFPIIEVSFLEFLQRSLTPEGVKAKIEQAKEQLLHKALEPLPIFGIKKATKNRSFTLDPTFEVKEDIRDSKGNLIAKRGTKINPLEKMQLNSSLLFLNGDDKEQLSWAKRQKGVNKWILVQGKPIEIEEKLSRPIFFDQNGFYTSRFKIENTPAKVSQKGRALLVEEVALGELR